MICRNGLSVVLDHYDSQPSIDCIRIYLEMCDVSTCTRNQRKVLTLSLLPSPSALPQSTLSTSLQTSPSILKSVYTKIENQNNRQVHLHVYF